MDFYHDPHYITLRQVQEIVPIPAFVKQAKYSTSEELQELPDNAFAWPEKRLFPINNEANAYMSSAYFFTKEGQVRYPGVTKNLMKAAFIFGIEKDVLSLVKTILQAQEKQAEIKNEDFGLVTEVNGVPLKKYYMPDRTCTEKAAEYFTKNYSKYPLSWRQQIASKLLEKSAQFGLEVPPVVHAYAKDFVSDSVKTAAMIAVRGLELPESGPAKLYLRLGQAAIGNMSSPEVLTKVASVITQMDHLFNLDSLWGKRFPDPILSVFNFPIKEAQDKISIMNILGNQYSLDELTSVDPGVYEEALGSDFVTQVMDPTGRVSADSLQQVVPALPRPDKAILVKYLNQALASQTSAEPQPKKLVAPLDLR